MSTDGDRILRVHCGSCICWGVRGDSSHTLQHLRQSSWVAALGFRLVLGEPFRMEPESYTCKVCAQSSLLSPQLWDWFLIRVKNQASLKHCHENIFVPLDIHIQWVVKKDSLFLSLLPLSLSLFSSLLFSLFLFTLLHHPPPTFSPSLPHSLNNVSWGIGRDKPGDELAFTERHALSHIPQQRLWTVRRKTEIHGGLLAL